METVSARFDGGIENSGSRAPKFRAEVRGLNFELLNRINRGKNNKIRTVQEIDGVGIVVNSIQHVIVLRRAEAIGRECACCRIAPRVCLR